MTEDSLAELKAKVKRADNLKMLISRLSGGIENFKSAKAVWFGIESGDFYLPTYSAVNQARLSHAELYREVKGDDVPGMACDIRAAIVKALTERKEAAEQELAKL